VTTATVTAGQSGAPRPATKPASANKPLAIFAGVVVLAVVGFGGHLVLSRRAADLRTAAADRAATERYDTEAALGRRVEASAASFERRLASGTAAFPSRRDQAEIITDLDALASRCGVAWSDGSQGATVPVQGVPGPTGGVAPWDVTVAVQGGLPEVVSFVQGISHMPRAASPSALSLTWPSRTVVKATLTVVAWSAGRNPSGAVPASSAAGGAA